MAEKQVTVVLKTLTQQVESGMKRKELAKFYNLPEAQMAKCLKDAGLRIRKFHSPSFILIKDEESEENVSNELSNPIINAENIISNEKEVEKWQKLFK